MNVLWDWTWRKLIEFFNEVDIDMENKILQIVAEVSEMNIEEITFHSELVDDLEIDSMMSLEILTRLEKEFSISLSEEDFAKFDTVNDIISLVGEKINEG